MADDVSDVTVEEMLECARREVKQRERVYARRVEAKAMSPEQATRETRRMKAIVAHFETLAQKARLI